MCLCAMRTSIILVKTSLHNPSIRVNMANLTLVFDRNPDVEFCSVHLTQKILDQCDILLKKPNKITSCKFFPFETKMRHQFSETGDEVPLLAVTSPG